MLSTVMSPNSRAELISSPWVSSRAPPSVISSIMSYSSSSVTETSPSLPDNFAAAWPILVRIQEMGENRRIKKHSDPAVARANRSLYRFAMLFGSISPRKNTAMVVTSVPTVTALRPHRRVTCTVTIDAMTRCTILVPIRIVVTARSKFSRTNIAFSALESPRSTAVLILILLTDANAVSATPK